MSSNRLDPFAELHTSARLPVADDLRRAFDLAALRKEAMVLETGRQWNGVTKIMSRCDHARRREQHLYDTRYDSRVEQARRRLVDEAAAKHPEFKPRWAGEDVFDAAATLRQAQREVRFSHEQRLDRIDTLERRELRSLVGQSMRENNLRGLAREEFGRATDRRSGLERRGGWVRKRH